MWTMVMERIMLHCMLGSKKYEDGNNFKWLKGSY